jgi:hypothetical protein
LQALAHTLLDHDNLEGIPMIRDPSAQVTRFDPVSRASASA